MSILPDHDANLPDRRWAICSGLAGLAALASYVLLAAAPVPSWATAPLAFGFAAGIALTTIALHLGVLATVAPRLGLLAAIANTVAAGELTAMLLVQLAVKATVAHPGSAFVAVWLGLDVAWDLFVGTGTVLLGVALWHHAAFRLVIAPAGIVVGVLLLALNSATFPAPPAEAGLFDVGPFVGLWYVVLSVRVLWLARARSGQHPS